MSDDKLRIYFFSPYCLLRNTTNRIFDMRMLDAFVEHHIDVTCVYPYVYMKENIKQKEIFTAYGLENKFRLRMQFTPLWESANKKIVFAMTWISFAISFLRIILENIGRLESTVIISREVVVIIPALVIKKILGPLCPVKIIPHLDEVKKQKYKRWAYKNVSGILPVVSSIRDALIKQEGMPLEKFCVMYAPVSEFKNDCSKAEARKIIKYDSPVPLVVYTGKVGIGVSELYYILEASQLLPQYHFLFTGGKKSMVEHFRKYCSERGLTNITFTGFFNDSSFVRYYQLSADVLVSYYNKKDHAVDFNYPQKLQEYISTHNPVVTPDFAATRDVINKDNAFFVEPNNPESLAVGIKEAIENKELAKQKAEAAYEASKIVTFNYQTREFLKFFRSLK